MLHEIFKGMDNASELINENFEELKPQFGGNDDDGYWVRYPDGTLECTLTIAGGLGQGGHTITFPQEFSSPPAVYGHDHSSTVTQLKYIVARSVTTKSCVVYPFISFTSRADTEGPIKIIVKGRWK